jgi:O-antigen/teichoic acid export membrane protein
LYVRFLGQHQWGLLSIILSWSALLLVLESGVTLAITRHFVMTGVAQKNTAATNLRRLEAYYLGVAGLCAAAGGIWALVRIGATCHPLASGSCGAQSFVPEMLCLAAAQISGAIYKGILVGTGNHLRLNLLVSGFSVGRHSVAVTLTWAFHSLEAAVSGMILVFLVEAICRRLAVLKFLQDVKGAEPAASKVAATGAMVLTASAVVGASTTQLDKLLLTREVSPADFGVYAVASSLSLAMLQMVYPVVQTLIPRLADFSRLKGSKKPRQVLAYILISILLLAFVIVPAAKSFLKWWIPNVEIATGAYPLLLIHLLGTALNALSIPSHLRALAEHRDFTILGVNAMALLAQLMTIVLLAGDLGVKAGALSWAAANAVLLIGYLVSLQLVQPKA